MSLSASLPEKNVPKSSNQFSNKHGFHCGRFGAVSSGFQSVDVIDPAKVREKLSLSPLLSLVLQNMIRSDSSESESELSFCRRVRMEDRSKLENRRKLWDLVDRRNDCQLYQKMGQPGFTW